MQNALKMDTLSAGKLPRDISSVRQVMLIAGIDKDVNKLEHLLGGIYDVVVVSDTKALLSEAINNNIAVIIIYQQVANDSGLKCCKLLKSHPLCKDIPTIFILENESVAEELIALQLGVMDCLVKPINPILLNAKLKNYMEQDERIKELELYSCTDGLTGLYNRVYLDTTLMKEWFQVKRSKQAISAIMIDIDYFKVFNDNYGHLRGDECLKVIAKTIEDSNKRDADFTARYGGEEFIVLLRDTDLQGATQLAEQIVANVAALKIPSPVEGREFVSVSAGVAQCYPHTEPANDPAKLVELADKKLFEAKNSGKNKVCY